MGYSRKSAKKRGAGHEHGFLPTVGENMKQGSTVRAYKYETLASAMNQGSNKRSFNKSKNFIGNAMHQGDK